MLLLERTMRINCRPARLGIVNLSKMNKVKGKKERKKEEVDFFLDFILKVYFVLLPNGPQDSASFSVYEQLVESPFFFNYFPYLFFFFVFLGWLLYGRFSLSSSNVFSRWVNLLLLLFITPQNE